MYKIIHKNFWITSPNRKKGGGFEIGELGVPSWGRKMDPLKKINN